MSSLDLLEVGSYILKRQPYRNITLVRVEGRVDGKNIDRWAIRNGENVCLDKDGDWVIEERPSSRDDEYYKMHRWLDPEEAYRFWLTKEAKNNQEA